MIIYQINKLMIKQLKFQNKYIIQFLVSQNINMMIILFLYLLEMLKYMELKIILL